MWVWQHKDNNPTKSRHHTLLQRFKLWCDEKVKSLYQRWIFYLNGLPWLKPKLELTIIETQKAMKMTRKVMSLHFLLCLMIPSLSLPSLEVYLPITAPRGPLIFCFSLSLSENPQEQHGGAFLLKTKRVSSLSFLCVHCSRRVWKHLKGISVF